MYTAKEHWAQLEFSKTCITVSTNNIKIKQRDYLPSGKYPIIDQGADLIGGFYDNVECLVKTEPPYVVFGDHTKVIKFVAFKFIPGADGVKVLSPCACYDPKLFYYFMKQLPLPDKGYARHFQHLAKAMMPLPPLPEQRAIVGKLETLLSELDNAVASLKQAKEQIKTYRQSVLKAAFTGKLTEEWRSQQTDFAKYKLQAISLHVNKINSNCKNENSEFLYIDISSIDNLGNKVANHKIYNWETAPSRAQQIISKDDILFSTVRTYLKNIAYVDKDIYNNQICSTGFTVIRANPHFVLPKYLFYYTVSDLFIQPLNELQSGSSYPAVRDSDVFKQLIPICPLAEQGQILYEIESRFSIADQLDQAIDDNIGKTTALRQSLLKQAFEGRLLNEQELLETRQAPDWEPAEKLLVRIKAIKPRCNNA